MEYRVTYDHGQEKYSFAQGFSKDFKIDRTAVITVRDVQYGREDFPYLKLVTSGGETLIPKDRVIKIELIK